MANLLTQDINFTYIMAKNRAKLPPLPEVDRAMEERSTQKIESKSSARLNGSRTKAFGTPKRIAHDSSSFYARKMYTHQPQATRSSSRPEASLPEAARNRIFCKSSEQMSELPDNCIHLMVTSPPYNAAKDYDSDLSLEEYLSLLRRVFAECYRVLVDGGRACVNIANLGRKPYIPLSAWVTQLMLEVGFLMRGEVIWQKGAGAGVSMAWGSWRSASNPVLRDTHEYILLFSKASYKRSSTVGRSTIEKEDFMDWTKSVWQFAPASAKKVGHPAPFPPELPKRLIHLYTFEHDVVLDPFMGSGTTASVAAQLGRLFVGYEVDETYASGAEEQLKALSLHHS